ncbi:molybdate ABC transporter substrate-binding protein [Alginatibacterium sediminis]|uniref:Molybdate ABC transporter substrate-binding protein n=1 Tax=Alginatibacterium sediminis TaxID=2164068 RepID=A0A420EB33_9ALTE|nr:molybdate ABC transporter substrate-binding protein [Alginatibacterium sediminis]RKF17852.1 molybdate ABC transporter substrate-binding protein [Alginatibacterium sediminis]
MWQCLKAVLLGTLFYLTSLSPSYALQLAVASNFAKPMRALLDAYPDQSVEIGVSFGSTGQLYTQIEHGAPFHIFLAADQQRPHRAVNNKLAVPGSQFSYAQGRLVLWGPYWETEVTQDALASNLGSRIAMANPKIAPYGLAAQQCQQYFSDLLPTKPTLIVAQNVGQSFQFTSSGNVDFGYVSLSQVLGDQASSRYWILPQACYQPILQDAVLLSNAATNRDALAFFAYLKSPAAQQIIQEHGYHVLAKPIKENDEP